MNHTLTVANHRTVQTEVGQVPHAKWRIGRDAIRLTWKPVYQYQNRGRRADGTHVVRKYTTAGTGFVGRGRKKHVKDYKRFFR